MSFTVGMPYKTFR